MSRQYFALRYQLNSRTRYLIWYTNDRDGLVIGPQGQMPSFATCEDALAYAQAQGLLPIDAAAATLHNIDQVARWLKRKCPIRPDCHVFLSSWNLFGDVSASVGGGFDENKEQTQTIYMKLFWGNNLPAITPPGKCYEPIWSGHEYRIMRGVLREGLTLFRSRVGVERGGE